MKTTISLPDPIFAEAEALAQQLEMSRSELYTEALKAYLRRYNRERIFRLLLVSFTERSNAIRIISARVATRSESEDYDNNAF